VRGFNNDWKKSIDSINSEVMQAFANFKNGTAILQVSLIGQTSLHELCVVGIRSVDPILSSFQ
jgi:hypothetical protein